MAESATLFGIAVDPLTLEEAIDRCRAALATRTRLLIGVVNAAKIITMRHDPVLRDSVVGADVVLADGQAVVWASRVLGHRLPERVTGIDLFERLLEVADGGQHRIYLLGARQEVLDACVRIIGEQHPGAVIAGARNGYFAESETPEVAAEIAAADADMLFIAMSSPQKENFLAAYADRLGVPILHGVGGSFDVLAGVTARAPRRWQQLGLEWLYRLIQEPRRLWRRYLVTNTAFIALVLRERFAPTAPYRKSLP